MASASICSGTASVEAHSGYARVRIDPDRQRWSSVGGQRHRSLVESAEFCTAPSGGSLASKLPARFEVQTRARDDPNKATLRQGNIPG